MTVQPPLSMDVLYTLVQGPLISCRTDRYTDDISVVGLPNIQPRDVCFVVYNRIATDHRQTLVQRYATNLGSLFRGGFTTGGSGLGLRICAECVVAEYGFASVDRCIDAGYVGAMLHDAYFVAWIHWPAA